MEPVRVGVIGIGGFGRTHLESLERCEANGSARLVAAVAPLPWNPANGEEQREAALRARGVRIYRDYRDMLDGERGSMDLVTIPVGIHLHAPMSIDALEAGYHVLCEKPAAGTVSEALRMLDARAKSNRILAVGYQHLHTPAIRKIREITRSGVLGRLEQARTLVLWPRDSAYYARNGWAGKLSFNGVAIMDSPVQNAAAHFLQNMLYVAGGAPGEEAAAAPVKSAANAFAANRPFAANYSCAAPAAVYAENYHANAIESADTQFVRVTTTGGVRIVFVASHAVPEEREPKTVFEYERGRIVWEISGKTRVAHTDPSGSVTEEETFDNGEAQVHDLPFIDVLGAIREGRGPQSDIVDALQHTRCVEAAFASSSGVAAIGGEWLEARATDSGTLTLVRGLVPLLERAFETGRGFAEAGDNAPAWSVSGREVSTPA